MEHFESDGVEDSGRKYGDFENLKVYQLAYDLAMNIFELTKNFPKEETYSLTDQIRRSSRSVVSNLAESYRKRQYPKHFLAKLSDADMECAETITWLRFSNDCRYLDDQTTSQLIAKYHEVGRMLGGIIRNPDNFLIT